MKPLETLLRKIIVLAVLALLGLLVRQGIPQEVADELNPLVMNVVDAYLPIILPVVGGFFHQLYDQVIAARMLNAARQLPANVPIEHIAEKALGDGTNRKAAALLVGVRPNPKIEKFI